ncbi:MAG TPA: hypothetical protein VFF06_25405 [Polyangia bacterium]|nr:hypothetical protein [Polyangia bacterium]
MATRLALPLAGLGAAFTALALWVSGVPWRALDALVLGLFAVGLLLSAGGYVLGAAARARQLAVVGIGVNGFGVAMLVILYGAG